MEEEKLERSIRKSEIPGLTREEEEAQLEKVIGIAERNLEQAKADIRSANEDLADLMETYDAKEAEGLALWNNATAKLNAYQHGLARLEKARKSRISGGLIFRIRGLRFQSRITSDASVFPMRKRSRSCSTGGRRFPPSIMKTAPGRAAIR